MHLRRTAITRYPPLGESRDAAHPKIDSLPAGNFNSCRVHTLEWLRRKAHTRISSPDRRSPGNTELIPTRRSEDASSSGGTKATAHVKTLPQSANRTRVARVATSVTTRILNCSTMRKKKWKEWIKNQSSLYRMIFARGMRMASSSPFFLEPKSAAAGWEKRAVMNSVENDLGTL